MFKYILCLNINYAMRQVKDKQSLSLLNAEHSSTFISHERDDVSTQVSNQDLS
jgi:hypothetical protein